MLSCYLPSLSSYSYPVVRKAFKHSLDSDEVKETQTRAEVPAELGPRFASQIPHRSSGALVRLISGGFYCSCPLYKLCCPPLLLAQGCRGHQARAGTFCSLPELHAAGEVPPFCWPTLAGGQKARRTLAAFSTFKQVTRILFEG